MAAAATLSELFSGTVRHFPIAITSALGVAGLATGRPAWILAAVGSVITAVVVLGLQYILLKGFALGPMPGDAVLQACGVIPTVAAGTPYFATPSVWIAMTMFLATYIITAGANVATTRPSGQPNEALSVQQRKSVGTLSIVTTVLLVLFLIIARARTSCETLLGALSGAVVGAALGYSLWHAFSASDPLAGDIHGVMAGLRPGSLRTGAVACVPGN
jgi:hypothetical protein